jgi:hypothetical protein|nr:MAG TPA: hypothetical protein [Caudoviricetes sp.]
MNFIKRFLKDVFKKVRRRGRIKSREMLINNFYPNRCARKLLKMEDRKDKKGNIRRFKI